MCHILYVPPRRIRELRNLVMTNKIIREFSYMHMYICNCCLLHELQQADPARHDFVPLHQ